MLEYFKDNFNRDLAKFYFLALISRAPYAFLISIYYLFSSSWSIYDIWLSFVISSVVSLVLKLPVAHFWDKYWHKKVYILWILWASIGSFLVPFISNFYVFIIAQVLLFSSFTLSSSSTTSFKYNFLSSHWKEKDFSKVFWKISWRISIIAWFITLSIPLFYSVYKPLPFVIWWVFQLLWVLILSSINFSHKENNAKKENIIDIDKDNIWFFYTLKKIYATWLFPIWIFFGFITSFFLVESSFRYIYLESVTGSLFMISMVVFISRIVWFIVWEFSHKIIEKLELEEFLFFETFFFSWIFIFTHFFQFNPYVTIFLVSFILWYMHWRRPLIWQYILELSWKYSKDRALFISSLWIFVNIFGLIFPFWISYIYNNYLNNVYLIKSIFFLIILFIIYVFCYISIKRYKLSNYELKKS